MRAIDLYPLKLQPALHVKVWGGRRLHEVLDKPPPDDQPYGESWELHDSVVVTNGPLAGQTLREIMNENASQLLGTSAITQPKVFPCLLNSLMRNSGCRYRCTPMMRKLEISKESRVARRKPGSSSSPRKERS